MTLLRLFKVGGAWLLAGHLAACAEANGPTEGSRILDPQLTSSSGGIDTSVTPTSFNEYGGVVVDASTDSLGAWRPISDVAIELIRVDEERQTTVVLATGVTGVDGAYTITDPTKAPFWTLKVRATPKAGSGYRAALPTPAYTTVLMNQDRNQMALERIDEPNQTTPPILFHGVVLDAPQFGTSGPGVPGAIVGLQRVIKERYPDGGGPAVRELDSKIDYGITDANGRFIMRASRGPGTYLIHTIAPKGYRAIDWTPTAFLTEQTQISHYPATLRVGKVGN